MFKFIKNIFYYKQCYNNKNILSKIDCVRRRLNIDPYSDKYRKLAIRSIESNIVDYTTAINDILHGLEYGDVVIKRIRESDVKTFRLGDWFTDSEQSILFNTNRTWLDFLNACYDINMWFEANSKDMSNVKMYSLSMKIRPYIINVDLVIDDLINRQQGE